MYTTTCGGVLLFSFITALFVPDYARAQGTDGERLAQCDRDLCDIIRVPSETGQPLRCDLGQTFFKEQTKKAARSKGLTWPLGDARCTVKLDVPRAVLARAMTKEEYTLRVPPHRVECEVGLGDGRYPATISLAPRVEFEDGRAKAVALGVEKIEANIVIRALLWTASKLDENLGLFEDDFVKGVNHYIARHCRARPSIRRNASVEAAPAR
jgi:hypothetical protein